MSAGIRRENPDFRFSCALRQGMVAPFPVMSTFLDQILADVRDELAATKSRRPSSEIRAMLSDAPPSRDLHGALSGEFGIIAEIKERSPSVGPMRAENVADAPAAYEESPIVRGLSVLTNALHFGMSVERLAEIRSGVTKPVLRKDFMIDEYQVREARAFGADAILLMANVLDSSQLAGFYDLARELGMDALFEVHTEDEIADLPKDARIVGINSRKFKSTTGFVGATGSSSNDFSLAFDAFDLADKLPEGTLHVAESGLSVENIAIARNRFNAALIGTSLLRDPKGVRACLERFGEALNPIVPQ